MLWLDRLVAEMLLPLAAWVFASSLDDLFLDVCFFFVWFRSRWRRAPLYGFSLRPRVPQRERKIALVIPCWEEAGVIREMLENNLTGIEYRDYEVWLGALSERPANDRRSGEMQGEVFAYSLRRLPPPRSYDKSRLLELDHEGNPAS